MTEGSQKMYDHISAFPDMWDEAWQLCKEFDVTLSRSPKAMLMCGMGGSSIGGALLKSLADADTPIPLALSRSYNVPGWLNEDSLAVLTSYSGNTEETLSAFEEAGRSGASRICITTGGQLGTHASNLNLPHILVPGGSPPRAALPYTFVPLLHVARELGIVDVSESDLRETSSVLRELTITFGGQDAGAASDLADVLLNRIPIVYSGPDLFSAVNLRWRGQIQENAKSIAFGNLYPELNHNEIVGWEASGEHLKQVVVIELADIDDPEPVLQRMNLTRSLLKSKAASWVRIEGIGESRLARMMSMVLLGDWVSFWLSQRKQVDPMPVELIDALKAGLNGQG